MVILSTLSLVVVVFPSLLDSGQGGDIRGSPRDGRKVFQVESTLPEGGAVEGSVVYTTSLHFSEDSFSFRWTDSLFPKTTRNYTDPSN